MSQFYFFTDISYLQTPQTDTQAFGPVVGNLDTQYRVNSLHTASADCTAYAVTSGFIQLQDVSTSSDLVNIILKPFEQPELNGIKVKYFIYRGVKKSCLLLSEQIVSKDSTTLEVVKDIWDYQAISSAITGEDTTPSAEILLKTNSSYATIEDIFTTDTTYCLHKVTAGDSIGIFDKDHIGFEIMLDGYNLDSSLSYAKVLDHIITADALSTPPTYAEKAQREQVLYYLDPAALYGMYYSSTTGVMVYNAGTAQSVKGDDLYTTILNGKFYNKDIVYIDMRFHTGLSYPFYGDYTDKIYIPTTSFDYCKNQWPIFKLTTGNYSTISDKFPINLKIYRTNSETAGAIYFATSDTCDMYSGKIRVKPEGKNRFTPATITNADIDTENKNTKASPSLTNTSMVKGYSTFLFYGYVSGTSSTSNSLVASYVKVFVNTPFRSETPFTTTHYIDNLFPIKETLPTVTAGTIINKHVGYETYVSNSQKKLVGTTEKVNHKIVPGIYDSCISFDSNRVTLFAVPKVSSSVDTPYDLSHSFDDSTENYAYFLKYAETILKGQAVQKFTIKPTGSDEIQFLAFTEKLFAETKSQVVENVIAIILKKEEYQSLLATINTNFNTDIHPVFIQRVYNSGVTEDYSYTDTNSKTYNYKKLTLQLTGMGADGNVLTESSGIDVYSADGAIYCSPLADSEYSDLVASPITDFYEGDIIVELSETVKNNSTLASIMSVVTNTSFFNEWIVEVIRVGGYENTVLIDLYSYSGTADAQTIYYNNKLKVAYNTNMLGYSRPIDIVETLFHELIHTYFDSIIYKQKGSTDAKYLNPLLERKEYKDVKDYYDTFGIDEDKPEMDGQHNLMAKSPYRNYIIKGMKEYDALTNTTDHSGSVKYQNVFDSINNYPVISCNYTTEDFYQAISWSGLFRVGSDSNIATREWRKFAKQDKNKYLAYFFIILDQSDYFKNTFIDLKTNLTYTYYDSTGNYYKTNSVNTKIFDLYSES